MSREELIQLIEKEFKFTLLNLNELMNLEKERLGFKREDLVFVSSGDISKFYWCPMQTYLTLLKNEEDKFTGYLQDKIEYSIKLNKVNSVPKNEKELLKIGNDLELNDIFELLKKNSPNFSNEEIKNAKKQLKNCKSQQEKGHIFETIYAKKLPQIHWFVKHKNFILTCMPDGISKDFVYEFKSSKNRFFSKFSIKKAKLQADIYGLCFNKENKEIDQLIVSENKIENIKEKINISEINYVIEKLNEIISGKLPKKPKEEFKCRTCEFKSKCKLIHTF